MIWETPRFVEIKMDAEIGSYQEDFDSERDPNLCDDETSAADD